MLRRSGKVWLMTIILTLVPLGGALLLLYGFGRLAVRKRRAATVDPYQEWLATRELIRSRRPEPAAEGDRRVVARR